MIATFSLLQSTRLAESDIEGGPPDISKMDVSGTNTWTLNHMSIEHRSLHTGRDDDMTYHFALDTKCY